MKKLIAGNWKMNGNAGSASALSWEIENRIEADAGILNRCDFVVCPPFVHLFTVKDRLRAMKLGGQDCSDQESGAYTGDISASMLKDIGASYVILGHSERRQGHGETSETVASKATVAHDCGLITIVCVGETEGERAAREEFAVVSKQLDESLPKGSSVSNTVIAYEPVWAIGTGKTATAEDIRAMHAFIREKLTEKLAEGEKMRILYGGSVKPSNAGEIFSVENVDGALIGGASLKTDDFMGIAQSVKI